MQNRIKAVIAVVYTAAAVATGAYLVPQKVKIETKIVEVEKKSQNKEAEKKKTTHKKIVTEETTKPDGTKIVTTTTTDDTSSDVKIKDKETSENSKDNSSNKETTQVGSKVTISALAGLNFGSFLPVYGASVTKPVFGPLTLGFWGLSNTTGGISLGLQF